MWQLGLDKFTLKFLICYFWTFKNRFWLDPGYLKIDFFALFLGGSGFLTSVSTKPNADNGPILGWSRRIHPATDTSERWTFAQRAIYLFSNICVGLQRSFGPKSRLDFVDTDVKHPEPPKKRAKQPIWDTRDPAKIYFWKSKNSRWKPSRWTCPDPTATSTQYQIPFAWA